MNGTLVISLDFELMWGVRDHRSASEYGDAVLGGRAAIPEILARFRTSGVRATWATVGLLFARNRDEMLSYAPARQPQYAAPYLSPYPALKSGEVGEDEQNDPLHFALSLINRIADTPGQEIATHTYSHFYCLEPGQDIAMFEADLVAACAIAEARGYTIKSLVFPRNQTSAEHVRTSAALGIDIYRGEAHSWLYQPRTGAQTTLPVRAMRFLDGALPVAKKQVTKAFKIGSAVDVPASRFLRPWSKKLGIYNALHIRRIQAEMEAAARLGGVYHLWWHPHNFGRDTAVNLARLDTILNTFRYCRDTYGMTSRAMRDFTSPVVEEDEIQSRTCSFT